MLVLTRDPSIVQRDQPIVQICHSCTTLSRDSDFQLRIHQKLLVSLAPPGPDCMVRLGRLLRRVEMEGKGEREEREEREVMCRKGRSENGREVMEREERRNPQFTPL